MVDVLIPYSHESVWHDRELLYCLRSLNDNFEDLNNVYVIGKHFPEWLTNVIKVEAEDLLKRNKDGNIIQKIITCIENYEVTDKVLFISDDQLILKKINSNQILPYCSTDYPSEQAGGRWKQRFKNTMDILKSRGKSWFNYETHLPVVYNSKEFVEIIKTFPYYEEGAGITINTAYFNSVILQHNQLIKGIKVSCERNLDYQTIVERANESLFLGYNDNGLTIELRKFISETFNKVSKFEIV